MRKAINSSWWMSLGLACALNLGAGAMFAADTLVTTTPEFAPPPVVAESDPTEAREEAATPESLEESDETETGLALESLESLEAAPSAAAKKKAAALKAKVAGAYKDPFYNNDFSYLNDPNYDDFHWGENLKQMHFGDCWVADIGGQYRARYHAERNHRGLGLTGRDDDFLLHRTRLFANVRYGNLFRFYGEYIDAESNYENFAPRSIEVNRSDIQNLFVDALLLGDGPDKLTFRIGRQELLYGSQRLVSPLDWANTRRTFDGFKFLYTTADWNADFFYTRPVIVDPIHFDNPSYDQEFFGLWATNKAVKNQTIDLFALQFNNATAPNNFQYTTLGGRHTGSDCDFLWDFEGGVQFGENSNGSGHSAGFATGGIGRSWANHSWKPQLWFYYDWANGNDLRGAGQGFNHLFPLAHKYLGFMDLYGRSNIESPNILLTAQPHEKWKLTVWYLYMFLENKNDSPYNVNMSPFNPGGAPGSADLGHELDLVVTYTIRPRLEWLFGYSHFWAGDYYSTTPGITYDGNADFYYTHVQWNF